MGSGHAIKSKPEPIPLDFVPGVVIDELKMENRGQATNALVPCWGAQLGKRVLAAGGTKSTVLPRANCNAYHLFPDIAVLVSQQESKTELPKMSGTGEPMECVVAKC